MYKLGYEINLPFGNPQIAGALLQKTGPCRFGHRVVCSVPAGEKIWRHPSDRLGAGQRIACNQWKWS